MGAYAFETLASQQQQFATQVFELVQQTAASISALSVTLSSSAHLQAANSRLQLLQVQRENVELHLSRAPPIKAWRPLSDRKGVNDLDYRVWTCSIYT